MNRGFDEDGLRTEIRAALAHAGAADLECSHADVGYGFGSWSPAFLRLLGRHDLIALSWPQRFGGRGLPARASFVLLQELAAARAPAEALLYSLAVGQCIVTEGDPRLQEEFLGPLREGRITFAESLSEPDAGSDLFALRTKAVQRGTEWVIDGAKVWTSNGAFADYALVAVRTNPDAARHKGISVFVVDLDSPGVQRAPITDLTGEPSFAEIRFDGVVVPGHHLVGARDGGIAGVLEALEWDRLYGRCVKAPFLRTELADVVTWLQQQGRWDDDVARDRLAALAVEIEVCDALFETALQAMDSGAADAVTAVSAAKVFADELGQRCYEAFAELIGPDAGLAGDDTPLGGRVGRGVLTAHGLLLAGGAPDIQRSTIARRGLGLVPA